MSEDLLQGLNNAQREAVLYENGPLLIVAGAGTGKTTVLTRRYLYQLTEKNLSTENVLALTFTEKAAGEMEDRVLDLMPAGAYDFWVSTFHGFCQRILEKYALEIGLPNKFKILNETDAWLLLKRRFDELPLDYYRPLSNPVKFLGELLKHFSRAKDQGVTPEKYLEFSENAILDGDEVFVTGEKARLKEIADCYFTYRRIMREEGAMDFGDLIVETLRLLHDRPRVLKELQKQFKYILVDEFQDTNWAQYDLVKLLAGKEKNLTVVGDDDQAIYKFRGASLANILQFREDFPEAKTVMLTSNYRSHQEILDSAYNFIKKNDPNRLEISLQNIGLSKKLESVRGQGGNVQVKWFDSLEEEAEGVALDIRRLKREFPELSWNNIAILSRSNDGAAPFLAALERQAIPYRFYAQSGLYSQPEILDICAYLQLASGNLESTAIWRILNSPIHKVSSESAAAIIQYAARKGIGMWEVLKNIRPVIGLSQEAINSIESIVNLVNALSESAKREKPLRIFQFVLDKTGYLSYAMKMPERQKMDVINLLNSFANRIKRYEQTVLGPTLRGFMEELQIEIDSGDEGALNLDPNEGPDLVKVLTVHSSKGLEFDHVYIVSMVDARFPSRPRSETIQLPEGLVNERLPQGDAHIEEERRLFYVALTRARINVVMTGAYDYGGLRKKKPSLFITESGLDIKEQKRDSTAEILLTVPERMEDIIQDVSSFPLKRRFSFTQLAAFEKCPLQYKYSHIYRIPVLGSFNKSFGQSMHLTLKDVLSLHKIRGESVQAELFGVLPVTNIDCSGFRVSLEEALVMYEERWIDEWYESREQHNKFKQIGREALKNFITIWTKHPPHPVYIEQSFDWRLGERSLKGAIDRIDEMETGGFAVYDYKTGTPKQSEDLDTSDKRQLWLYQLAMEDKGLSIKKLAYIYVQNGLEAQVNLLQGDKRDEFRNNLKEQMEKILISRFPPSPSPYICKHCDFRRICEFRKI